MTATTPSHPVEPDSGEPHDDSAPNTSQQPVEPEFGPMQPPGEPDDPGVKAPHP